MDNSDFTHKILRKSEKIKMKYRYDNARLKTNRKIFHAKIFSPQRQSEKILRPDELAHDYST
jgi:hypothetical protein